VLIAKAGCPLHEKTLPGFRKTLAFQVHAAKCRSHKDCVSKIACPAFYVSDARMKIDTDRCTGCTLCVQVCPENAILPVSRKEVQP
jgi:indolepyruvate ferredoxin oxidoreductase alpha subunit